MKLCMDCKHYGGVAAATGKYICNHPLNDFVHAVDGPEFKMDARLAPDGPRIPGQVRLGRKMVGEEEEHARGSIRWVPGNHNSPWLSTN